MGMHGKLFGHFYKVTHFVCDKYAFKKASYYFLRLIKKGGLSILTFNHIFHFQIGNNQINEQNTRVSKVVILCHIKKVLFGRN